MMNSENVPKEIFQSLIDRFGELGEMADGWKPATISYRRIRKTVPQFKRWREERCELLRVDAVNSEPLRVGAGESSASATDTNNTSFTTRSTTKRTIEKVWGSKATSKKPQKSMSHKATSGKTPNKFSILSSVKASDFRFVKFSSSQVWSHFSSLIFHDCSLRFSKQKVSYFKPFQSCPKGILRLWTRAFEANVPKKPCAKLCFRKRSGQ